MAKISVLRSSDCEVVDADWGELRWQASGQLGNSQDMTVGRCLLRPGQSNPKHSHPNCSEVLVVISGAIAHTVDETSPMAPHGEVEMAPGDTVTIPTGVPHQARNLSDREDAMLFIAFSSADRQTVAEE